MNNDINIYEAYLPLFTAKTRYTIVTGGRGSGKSFALACATLLSTYDDPFNILYTRYTLVSAEVSIIPEYVEKIDLMDRADDFTIRRREVVNDLTGATILFRGLKTSSKNQIAKLKSLNRIKTWILDEAQELVDESLFDTIDLSIREKDADNRVILVLNPDSVNHWIYRRFFVEAGVPEDFNGVKGNVTYIHTTYQDNLDNLDDGFIEIAETLRERNPEKWSHIFGGRWLLKKEGLIYQRWQEIKPEEYPHHLDQWYGNDWGYGGDPNALIRMCYDAQTQTIYLWEVCCTQLIPSDVFKAIKADAETIGYELENCLVYCDPARPDNITELRRRGVSAVKAVNRDKAGRISYLKGFKVKYVGETIHREVRAYSWQPHPQDMERFTDKPQDGNDHCFTANTLITTQDGRKPIVSIQKGDKVLTSEGWKTVVKKWDNGIKKVLCLCLNFGKFKVYIEATPEHKFKTERGWKELQSLQAGDKLFLQLDSMVGPTENTMAENITLQARGNYIGTSGNTIMGLYRKVIRCITRTSTSIITILKTLFVLLSRNISRYTLNSIDKMVSQNGQDKGFTTSDRVHQNGIEARKVESGTDSMQEIKSSRILNAHVLSAESPSQQKRKIQNTARKDAARKHEGIAGSITRQESAKCAENLSRQTSMESNEYAVCLVLQSIEEVGVKEAPVYDLTVEGCHEYYANGILVHNCMDAVSYGAVTHLRRLCILNEDGDS